MQIPWPHHLSAPAKILLTAKAPSQTVQVSSLALGHLLGSLTAPPERKAPLNLSSPKMPTSPAPSLLRSVPPLSLSHLLSRSSAAKPHLGGAFRPPLPTASLRMTCLSYLQDGPIDWSFLRERALDTLQETLYPRKEASLSDLSSQKKQELFQGFQRLLELLKRLH